VGDLSTISVILPTRDRPQMLASALRCIIAQHLRPSEVIVIDDGSPGVAAGVVDRIGLDARLPIQALEGPRAGPGAARNVGLQAARGSLVAFLDDDDLWFPDKLARQAEWFARRPTLGVAGTRCLRRTAICELPRPSSRPPRRLRLISQSALVRANRLSTSSVVARRECLAECGGFNESLPLAQDWDMWLRASGEWEIGILPLPLTVYRLHGAQRSANRLAMREWEAKVVELALCRGTLRGRWVRGVARRRLAWAHARLGRLLAREGDASRALAELRQSLRLFPYSPLVWTFLLRHVFDQRVPAGARS
jgi:glycosyltransferase involved in cell wall biosynthesis